MKGKSTPCVAFTISAGAAKTATNFPTRLVLHGAQFKQNITGCWESSSNVCRSSMDKKHKLTTIFTTSLYYSIYTWQVVGSSPEIASLKADLYAHFRYPVCLLLAIIIVCYVRITSKGSVYSHLSNPISSIHTRFSIMCQRHFRDKTVLIIRANYVVSPRDRNSHLLLVSKGLTTP